MINACRAELVALCAALVAAPSVNPPGDTRAAAEVLARFLASKGIAPEIAACVPHKPNVLASLEGAAGPGPHLVLNGHLDTIQPGDASAWTTPLHALTERDGRLMGLGAGNMKGGLAALAAAFAWLHTNRAAWAGRITLAAVADETVFGPDGADWLLRTRPDLRGDMLICGEGPGSMGLAIAEKGVLWLRIAADAPPGQGMLTTRGSSAVARLARALVGLDALNDIQVQPPAEVACLAGTAGAHGLRLSVNIGTLQGGEFISQRPGRAEAEVDMRVPPGLRLAQVEAIVDAVCRGVPGVSWSRIKGWDANWSTPDCAPARALSAAAVQVRGTPPPPVVRLPGSDASRWRALGVPAVCYGPQPTLASGPDDYVLATDLLDCARVYADAALRCLSPAHAAASPQTAFVAQHKPPD